MKGGMYLALCAVTLLARVSAGGASVGGGVPVDNKLAGKPQGIRKSAGVGVYAYQDSNGRRYEGIYDIDPTDLSNFVYAPNFQDFVPDFSQDFFPRFPFAPYAFGNPLFNMDPAEYYMNLGQQYAQAGMHFGQQFVPTFRRSNSNNGQASAAQAGIPFGQHFIPTFRGSSTNQGHAVVNQGQPGANQGYASPNQRQADGAGGSTANVQNRNGGNFAFAGGFVGPDGVRQVASISPANSNNPNIDVSSPPGRTDGGDGFVSVSSSSFASSSNVDGKTVETRRAKTVVNDNGNIKQYEVGN